MAEKNQVSLHWIITILMGLVLGAYGYIFTSVIDRVAKAEIKIEAINPTLLQIQTDLSEIKTDIKWMKNEQNDSKIK